MTPEEQIKKLEAEKAELAKQVETAKTEVTERDKKIEELNKTVTDKDAVIEQKNQDIVGARRKYKKLADMTDEEKADMTEAELKQKAEQDLLFEEQEADKKQRQEERSREINERKMAAIKKFVGDDKDLAEKLTANFDRIKDSDKAFTDGEISQFMNTAFNMLGEEKPEPVRAAVNQNSYEAPVINDGKQGEGSGFAETPEGKGLASSLGLSSANAEAPKTE